MGLRQVATICLSFLFLSAPAFAQEPQFTALTFQAWKDQQVLDAQNQALRASARMNQIKAGKGTSSESKDSAALPSNRIKKAGNGDQLSIAEKDLVRAQETMTSAANLQLADYINIYLPTLQDQPDAAAKLVDQLTKEELAEITKGLIRKGSPTSDTRRNVGGITAEALAVPSRRRML